MLLSPIFLETLVLTIVDNRFAVGVVDEPNTIPGRRYEIFRTYPVTNCTSPLCRGGPNPSTCKVSEACAATAAAPGLLPPRTIESTTYMDNKFPNPHSISNVVLDEVYHLYGEKPPLSVLVNVGPGIPSDNDVKKLKKLSQSFSWEPFKSLRRQREKVTPSPAVSVTVPAAENDLKRTVTSGSSSSSGSCTSMQAEILEQEHEKRIRKRLQDDYERRGIYYRLAPRRPGDKLSLNDVSLIDDTNTEVDEYLKMPETEELVKRAAKRYWGEIVPHETEAGETDDIVTGPKDGIERADYQPHIMETPESISRQSTMLNPAPDLTRPIHDSSYSTLNAARSDNVSTVVEGCEDNDKSPRSDPINQSWQSWTPLIISS